MPRRAPPHCRRPARRRARSLARRPQGAPRPREGADAPARRDRPRAARPALGARRRRLRLRCTRRPPLARRPLRRPAAAAGAALHARRWLGAGLPELLVHGRPRRRDDGPPRRPRRLLRRRLARAARRDRALQGAHGLEVPLGLVGGEHFNRDFHVSFDPDDRRDGKVDYNYGPTAFPNSEAPGLSVFCRGEDGAVFHTYSTFGRGVEVMIGTYPMLDLMPHGRGEREVPNKMEWVRHHDRYPTAAQPSACCHAA